MEDVINGHGLMAGAVRYNGYLTSKPLPVQETQIKILLKNQTLYVLSIFIRNKE